MNFSIDLSHGGDQQDAIHQMVECLVGGGIARLRWQYGDELLALATHENSQRRLVSGLKNHSGALMVRSVEAMADFVPSLPREVQRLFHRVLTPLHLSFADGVDDQILGELPPDARRLAEFQGQLRFAIPLSDVIRESLRLLPGPVTVMGLQKMPRQELIDIEVHVAPASQMLPVTVVQFQGDDWHLAEAGILTQEEISRMMAERIVFVCTGNTCRSPMAAAVFRKLLADRLGCLPDAIIQHGFDIASAGVAAMTGAPASPESVAVCAEHGVDLRSHASQPLHLEMLQASDHVYTMTAGHRDAIRDRFPDYALRVQLLSRRGQDVTDPIGSGMAAYEQCFSEITENLHALVNELTPPS